ncbi:hypothetical protein JQX13_03810 [Archangium violaceum]|uniref:hypothetical protein n=1 Tax=Archangium violaceum TaxID=83451 RepID=UPI00193C7F7A|nr:hypothetical protein [Archangium violaceum]QRK09290.1 hypothetical protein JQX13_03810 [Archangium violaceum]
MISLCRLLRAAFPFVVGGALATMGCSSEKTNTSSPPKKTRQSGADARRAKATAQWTVDSLPKTLARPATLEQSADFAWQQFLFLSSLAATPDGQTIPRGTRDPSGRLGQPGDLLVWQTYAHKTELRPNKPLTTAWDSLGMPTYDQAYRVPLVQGTPDARLDLWNNLDEDNEIGSCQLFGQYDSQPGAQRQKSLVLYEAKVNRDEYEYIRNVYGSDQHIGNTVGPNAGPTTCDNTVSDQDHGSLCKAQLRLKNNIANGQYGNTAQCDCPPEQAICLPCETSTTDGTIEVKAAWRKLLPNEPSDQYYTAQAIYYKYEYDSGSNSYQYKYYNDTFALIGLHIIRKLQNYPTFVFTSFEHVGEANAGDKYVIIDNDGAETSLATPATRQTGSNLARDQNHAIPPDIAKMNLFYSFLLQMENSVWANYQLVGVQAEVYDCEIADPPPPMGTPPKTACIRAQDKNVNTCLSMDPNYYMANLFVETDPFLNNFSGPGFGGNTFGMCQNTLFQQKPYNMGGCKGCHGVAQTTVGTDFSFLLDFGNNKPAKTPDTIMPPPAEIDGMRIFSSTGSGMSVPGPAQVCNAEPITQECTDFCRQQCDTMDCIAFNVSTAGCEIFSQDVPMSSLTLQEATGYNAYLSPGTLRPSPSDGGSAL